MEHVINAKLRNQAFWKFLIFFLVTTVIIIISVYFDTGISNKENASLRAQIRNYETQILKEQEFLIQADSATALLDSLNNVKGNYAFYNALVSQNLVYMSTMTKNLDSTNIYTHINKRCVNSLRSLQEKQGLVKDASERIDNLTRKLENYEDQGANGFNAQLPLRGSEF